MRKISTSLMIVILAFVLASCGCKHEWQDATCETPKTCTLCQETEGEPLGHSWQEATCDAPRTCSGCALTEGEALGHSWVDATCETPKTCTRCALTEGEAPGHQWGDGSCMEELVCTVCNGSNGQFGPHRDLATMNTAGEKIHISCLCGQEEDLTAQELTLRMLKGKWTMKVVQTDGKYYPPEPEHNWQEGTWLEFPSDTEAYGYQTGINDQGIQFVIPQELSDFQAGGMKFTAAGKQLPVLLCNTVGESSDGSAKPERLLMILGIHDYDAENMTEEEFLSFTFKGYLATLIRYTEDTNYFYCYDPEFTP